MGIGLFTASGVPSHPGCCRCLLVSPVKQHMLRHQGRPAPGTAATTVCLSVFIQNKLNDSATQSSKHCQSRTRLSAGIYFCRAGGATAAAAGATAFMGGKWPKGKDRKRADRAEEQKRQKDRRRAAGGCPGRKDKVDRGPRPGRKYIKRKESGREEETKLRDERRRAAAAAKGIGWSVALVDAAPRSTTPQGA